MAQIETHLRAVGECVSTLETSDPRSRQRRAERMAQIPVMTIPLGVRIPNRASRLLLEAVHSYIAGFYSGSVAVLAIAVEYSLRTLTGSQSNSRAVLALAKEKGIVDEDQACVLRAVQRYRNAVVHSDLSHLSEGLMLTEQPAVLMGDGVEAAGIAQAFILHEDDDRDVAAALADEAKVGRLLIETWELLPKLFASRQ